MTSHFDGSTYGAPVDFLAEVCGVESSTARRWKQKGLAPTKHHQRLTLALSGDLGALDPAWAGWTIRDGLICTPEGEQYSPGAVRAIRWRKDQLNELERRLAEPQQWKLL